MRRSILFLAAAAALCFLFLLPAAAEVDSTYAVTPTFSVRIPEGWIVDNGDFSFDNGDALYKVHFNTFGLKDTSGLNSETRRAHLQSCMEYFFGSARTAAEQAFSAPVSFGGREGLVFMTSMYSKYRLAGYMCFDDENNIILILIDGGKTNKDAEDPVNRKDLFLYMLGVDTAPVYSHSETPLRVQLPDGFEITKETDSGIQANGISGTCLYGLQTVVKDYGRDADMMDLFSYDDIVTCMWDQERTALTGTGITFEGGYFMDSFSFALNGNTDALSEGLNQINSGERPEGGYANSYLLFTGTTNGGDKAAVAFFSGGYKTTVVVLYGFARDGGEQPDPEALLKNLIVSR